MRKNRVLITAVLIMLAALTADRVFGSVSTPLQPEVSLSQTSFSQNLQALIDKHQPQKQASSNCHFAKVMREAEVDTPKIYSDANRLMGLFFKKIAATPEEKKRVLNFFIHAAETMQEVEEYLTWKR